MASQTEEAPDFTEHVICPVCGAAIATVKMDVRLIARYTCPQCGNEILLYLCESEAIDVIVIAPDVERAKPRSCPVRKVGACLHW